MGLASIISIGKSLFSKPLSGDTFGKIADAGDSANTVLSPTSSALEKQEAELHLAGIAADLISDVSPDVETKSIGLQINIQALATSRLILESDYFQGKPTSVLIKDFLSVEGNSLGVEASLLGFLPGPEAKFASAVVTAANTTTTLASLGIDGGAAYLDAHPGVAGTNGVAVSQDLRRLDSDLAQGQQGDADSRDAATQLITDINRGASPAGGGQKISASVDAQTSNRPCENSA